MLFCGSVFFIPTKYCDLPPLHKREFRGFLLLLFKNKYIKLIDKRLSNKSWQHNFFPKMFGSNKKITCVMSCVIHMIDLIGWVKLDMAKQAGWVWLGLGRINRVVGWVGLTRIFHMNFFFNKKNMYLPFKKSCNKLFDVKCIILNSPLISRMNYTY